MCVYVQRHKTTQDWHFTSCSSVVTVPCSQAFLDSHIFNYEHSVGMTYWGPFSSEQQTTCCVVAMMESYFVMFNLRPRSNKKQRSGSLRRFRSSAGRYSWRRSFHYFASIICFSLGHKTFFGLSVDSRSKPLRKTLAIWRDDADGPNRRRKSLPRLHFSRISAPSSHSSTAAATPPAAFPFWSRFHGRCGFFFSTSTFAPWLIAATLRSFDICVGCVYSRVWQRYFCEQHR